MLSPPSNVKFVALLLFACFQFCIFRLEIFKFPQRVQTVASNSSVTTLEPSTRLAPTIDPILPDVARPKIRQVSMRVYNATNETHNALDERCMKTHLEYGRKWGYPSHVLREDVRGKGQWRELIFSKPLYMLSLAVAEMAKPSGERAEWLM